MVNTLYLAELFKTSHLRLRDIRCEMKVCFFWSKWTSKITATNFGLSIVVLGLHRSSRPIVAI